VTFVPAYTVTEGLPGQLPVVLAVFTTETDGWITVHAVPMQTSPPPQPVPVATAGCVQLPEPSQTSLVQGLPSSGHVVPEGWSTTVQPPWPSHVELDWQAVAVHV
jgi:hypothetical protein